MLPVQVTARFDPDGKITPLRLVLEGRELAIDGVGRRWWDDSGLHILVMLNSNRVHELIYRSEGSTWYLHQLPATNHA